MTEKEFEALFGSDAEVDPNLSILAALGRLARARRPALDYAADVMEAGLEGKDFEVPAEAPLRMAAADAGVAGPRSAFPARYQGEGWSVVLLRGAGGVPRARLELGLGPLTLVVAGQEARIEAREDVLLPWIDAVPGALVLRPDGGAALTLIRQDQGG